MEIHNNPLMVAASGSFTDDWLMSARVFIRNAPDGEERESRIDYVFACLAESLGFLEVRLGNRQRVSVCVLEDEPAECSKFCRIGCAGCDVFERLAGSG